MDMLKKDGFDVPDQVTTVEEAKSAILKCLGYDQKGSNADLHENIYTGHSEEINTKDLENTKDSGGESND